MVAAAARNKERREVVIKMDVGSRPIKKVREDDRMSKRIRGWGIALAIAALQAPVVEACGMLAS